jgi:hypothetical protein
MLYGADQDEKRYSLATCIGIKCDTIQGEPNPKHISTSYVERQNLTMRMHMRRFTRLTNAFSKKAEMHAHAVAIHFMWYNFVKIHQTLKVTPAMAAGVTGSPVGSRRRDPAPTGRQLSADNAEHRSCPSGRIPTAKQGHVVL